MFPHGSRQKKLLTGIRRTTGSGRRRFWELLKKTSREIYYLGVPSGGGQDVVGVEPEGNAPRMDEIDQEWRKMSGCSENHQQKGWLATRETGKEGGAKGREGVLKMTRIWERRGKGEGGTGKDGDIALVRTILRRRPSRFSEAVDSRWGGAISITRNGNTTFTLFCVLIIL